MVQYIGIAGILTGFVLPFAGVVLSIGWYLIHRSEDKE